MSSIGVVCFMTLIIWFLVEVFIFNASIISIIFVIILILFSNYGFRLTFNGWRNIIERINMRHLSGYIVRSDLCYYR